MDTPSQGLPLTQAYSNSDYLTSLSMMTSQSEPEKNSTMPPGGHHHGLVFSSRKHSPCWMPIRSLTTDPMNLLNGLAGIVML